MNTKLIGITILILLFSMACNQVHKNGESGKSEDITSHNKDSVIYTCPMHHQIRAEKPGKCPICGMALIPLAHSTEKESDSVQVVTLSARQQFLGNIHTDAARQMTLSSQRILTGTTLLDPEEEKTISATVSGWIDKLYVRNPGERITPGQKLYDIYSPELLAAEKDYLLALKQQPLLKETSVDLEKTLKAMKQKLLRWGLSESQVHRLQNEKLTGTVTFYSHSSGFLTQKLKEEGDEVKEGDAVFNLADNKTLWVQAQLYDSELPLLENKHKVKVTIEAFPQKTFSGKIVFNSPVNNRDSRVHLLNIAIPNPGGKIQPGMLASVYLSIMAKHQAVTIPKSSIIYGEKHDYVWIKHRDKDSLSHENTFERRIVQLGMDNDSAVQVLQGIKPGEWVVHSGAYLVNSEYVLQHGSGPNMAGMTISDMRMSGKGK